MAAIIRHPPTIAKDWSAHSDLTTVRATRRTARRCTSTVPWCTPASRKRDPMDGWWPWPRSRARRSAMFVASSASALSDHCLPGSGVRPDPG